jgi:hypothetical protein
MSLARLNICLLNESPFVSCKLGESERPADPESRRVARYEVSAHLFLEQPRQVRIRIYFWNKLFVAKVDLEMLQVSTSVPKMTQFAGAPGRRDSPNRRFTPALGTSLTRLEVQGDSGVCVVIPVASVQMSLFVHKSCGWPCLGVVWESCASVPLLGTLLRPLTFPMSSLFYTPPYETLALAGKQTSAYTAIQYFYVCPEKRVCRRDPGDLS